MKPKIHSESPIIFMLLDGIKNNPGIESKKLAVLIGKSWSHVKKGLAFMNQNKIAGCCELGKLRRGWFVWAEAEQRNAGFMSLKAKSRLRASQRPPSARSQIEAMAAKDEDGASTLKICDMLDLCEKDANRQCVELVKRGRLFKGSRKGYRARWFATQEAAQAWEALPAGDYSEMRPKAGRPAQSEAAKEAAREAARAARQERARQRLEAAALRRMETPKAAPKKKTGAKYQAIKAKPANDAPVLLHSKPSDIKGAVDFSKAKVIVCPSPTHDARYQVAPGAVIQGEFSRQWQQLRGAA